LLRLCFRYPKPGFQCDRAHFLAPDNVWKGPRNPSLPDSQTQIIG
jgi:hypothetical protein